MSYIQSFKRYETKYMLTAVQKEQLIEAVGDMLVRDRYGMYSICNIYFDTDDFYLIEHSLDKPVYKEKLRIRSYGNASKNDNVFFEIKKKYRGVVYKRRITITQSEAEDYIQRQIVPQTLSGYHAKQIFSEIDFLMQKYKPSPKLYLAYDREAYYSERYPELRVTFDSGIRSRWDTLTLESDEKTIFLDTGIEDYRLMEIKSAGAIPLELCHILAELNIYPVSFSKYGNIYKQRKNSIMEVQNV